MLFINRGSHNCSKIVLHYDGMFYYNQNDNFGSRLEVKNSNFTILTYCRVKIEQVSDWGLLITYRYRKLAIYNRGFYNFYKKNCLVIIQELRSICMVNIVKYVFDDPIFAVKKQERS